MLRIILGVVALASVLVSCAKEEAPVQRVLTPEEVVIPTSNETGIDATWQAVEEARVVVVFIPTVGYTQASWQTTANRVNEQRWSALRIDPRSTPQSERAAGAPWSVSRSDSSQILTVYSEDIRAAIDWVENKVGSNVRIILVGSDLGGIAALRVAAHAPRVYGVALLSPPSSGELLSNDVIQSYGDRPLLVMTELPVEPTLTTGRTLDFVMQSRVSLRLRD